jgi:hypothetical protein
VAGELVSEIERSALVHAIPSTVRQTTTLQSSLVLPDVQAALLTEAFEMLTETQSSDTPSPDIELYVAPPGNERLSALSSSAHAAPWHGPVNVVLPPEVSGPDAVLQTPSLSMAVSKTCTVDAVPFGAVARSDRTPVPGSIRLWLRFVHCTVG